MDESTMSWLITMINLLAGSDCVFTDSGIGTDTVTQKSHADFCCRKEQFQIMLRD
jgi:hypothetical protein